MSLYLSLDMSNIVKWNFTRKITHRFCRSWTDFRHTSSDPFTSARWYLSGSVHPTGYHAGKTPLWGSLLFPGSKSSEAEGTYLCFLIVYTQQWDLSFSQEGVSTGHTQTAPTVRSKSMSWEELTGNYWGNIARDILHSGPPVPSWLLASWEPKPKSVLNGWPRLKLSLKKMIYWVTDWGPAWKDSFVNTVLLVPGSRGSGRAEPPSRSRILSSWSTEPFFVSGRESFTLFIYF